MRALSRLRPAFALAGALAFTLAGCAAQPAAPSTPSAHTPGRTGAASAAFPVTLHAANGSVRIDARPRAIVSLSPTATEMLYAIGAGGQVKAVDADSTYPPQAPRTKLSGLQLNVEAIVAEKPDLVVVSNYASALAKKLAPFSIPVLSLPAPAHVSGVYSEFTELGRATGHVPAAQREDTALRKRISAIVAAVPQHTRPITYYYELDSHYYSLTSDTFVGRLLAMLGMKSIADHAKGAAAAGGYPQLSAEYVLAANPDYIVLADTLCCHQSEATVSQRPGWGKLSAVRNKHVILLDDNIASRWGPRIPTLLQAVASALRAGGGA